METYSKVHPLPYAPTDTGDIYYPESDGKPMAETDLHIEEIIRMRHILKAYFAEKPDVYVSGNIMMYYEEGDIQSSVSPDILVSFGIGKKRRRTYKTWEEGKPPDFVMEFSSEGTYTDDLDKKVKLYARMGISEYFLYDAERRYLPSFLMGYRLVDGSYDKIPQQPDGGFFSEILNLTIHLQDESFGVYDPTTERWLQSAEERVEEAEDKAEKEAAARRKSEDEAKQEAAARQKAEDEVAQLQKEIKRLQDLSTPST